MAVQPKPKKEYSYGDVFISLENCVLPEEKLSETPSMKDRLDKEVETDLRILGCEFIQTAGILLKLPQVAMATGQILLQRFYYSKSLVKHDVEICSMACVFLAAKIEESPRRIRDVVNVFHHIKQKRSKRSQKQEWLQLTEEEFESQGELAMDMHTPTKQWTLLQASLIELCTNSERGSSI